MCRVSVVSVTRRCTVSICLMYDCSVPPESFTVSREEQNGRPRETLGPVSYTHLDVYKRQIHTYIFVCIFSRRTEKKITSQKLNEIE